MLATIINADTPVSEEKVRKVERRTLREVTVKIGLERIDMQEGITVEALLDSGATGLVMSSECTRKQDFKLKKLERLMNVRNVDGLLNKEGPIEHTVEVNIYYQGHRERTVKIVDSGLYFIFSFHFILLYFSFSFSFFYF